MTKGKPVTYNFTYLRKDISYKNGYDFPDSLLEIMPRGLSNRKSDLKKNISESSSNLLNQSFTN